MKLSKCAFERSNQDSEFEEKNFPQKSGLKVKKSGPKSQNGHFLGQKRVKSGFLGQAVHRRPETAMERHNALQAPSRINCNSHGQIFQKILKLVIISPKSCSEISGDFWHFESIL